MASPLLCGNDVRNMPDSVLKVLTNPEIIAINQDALGLQGKMMRKEGNCEVWMKLLDGGRIALAVMNRGEEPEEVVIPFDLLGFPMKAFVRDVWSHRNLGELEQLRLTLNPHVTAVFKLE